MSTRTTRSTRASSKLQASSSPNSASSSKSISRPSVAASESQEAEMSLEKEKENKNGKEGSVSKATVATSQGKNLVLKAKSATPAATERVSCTCQKGDDGTPMICCHECRTWYHFSCVDLDEADAEDISVYVCTLCSAKTGLYSLMSWEEADAVEEVKRGPTTVPAKPRKKSKTPKAPTPTEPPLKVSEPSSASEDSGSEDDYVADAKAKGGRGKRRTRRLSYLSESELSEFSDGPLPTRLRKASSPTLKRIAKRDPQNPTSRPPVKKAKVSGPSDDPARKYCLGKLEDVFRDIFLRYPRVRSKSEGEDGSVLEQAIDKQAEDLTEDEKSAVLENAKQFADDLEKCVFEIYSEPDKHGNSSAAAKYKDRFRMLQFNLSKVDRVVLHKRIISGSITPKEISLMSSTDLANEELKQSIKSAEQESLEQSILQKTTAPRTKITHKGLEDIEDLRGGSSNRERERQLEEEERMERERLARLRTVQPRQRTMSLSVPPESPVAPGGESWGAPPPVPAHAHTLDMSMDQQPTRPPLFLNTSSETVLPEPELNLADIINMDDEQPFSAQDPSPLDNPPPSSSSVDSNASPPTILRSPTGISPFAIQPSPSPAPPPSVPSAQTTTTPPHTPAFDLNSLWSLSNLTNLASSSSTVEPPPEESGPSKRKEDVVMETEPASIVADDQDFDMFLEEKEPEKPEGTQANFDSLPHVWSGKLNMPLDTAIPQETPVVARRIGGKTLDVISGSWRTLFPSGSLRIDGRVPVQNSAKFLLQMRMNPSKELVAVAFSPAPGADETGFKFLSEFLTNKGRHGLVFPWGNRPKDFHPGKELYIIPLAASDPLPDYIELLDDLQLPKSRTTNYLLGIWVLNKGKLTSPPPQPAPTPAPAVHVPTPIATPAPAPTPPPPAPASISPTAAPLLNPLAGLAATLPIDQTALAAELASLTPEQMALVTQALTQANLPAALVVAPIVPQQQQQPQRPPSAVQLPMPMSIPPESWGASSYSSGFPPNSGPNSSFPGSHPSNVREDFWRQDRQDRGGGSGRGRGRGRGRGDGGHSPVDSGWPRKNSGPSRRW